MEHHNELLDAWQGQPVMATFLGGAELLAFEKPSKAFRHPSFGIEEVRKAKTAVYELVEYDHLGVTFRRQEEGAPRFFVPWGAVLGIQGADPEL
jgi:hypothetical protein